MEQKNNLTHDRYGRLRDLDGFDGRPLLRGGRVVDDPEVMVRSWGGLYVGYKYPSGGSIFYQVSPANSRIGVSLAMFAEKISRWWMPKYNPGEKL